MGIITKGYTAYSELFSRTYSRTSAGSVQVANISKPLQSPDSIVSSALEESRFPAGFPVKQTPLSYSPRTREKRCRLWPVKLHFTLLQFGK